MELEVVADVSISKSNIAEFVGPKTTDSLPPRRPFLLLVFPLVRGYSSTRIGKKKNSSHQPQPNRGPFMYQHKKDHQDLHSARLLGGSPRKKQTHL